MKRNLTASIGALSALASAQAAQAQQACIAPADLDDTILYAMPIAYDATMTACDAAYAEDGFMKSKGSAFANRFRAKQDDAWPGAFRLLKVFALGRASNGQGSGSGDLDIMAMMDSMPPEALRPFLDALIQQMIAGEIKSDTCGEIERGVSLIAPLPVENVSGLITFIAEMADIKEPEMCSAETATKRPETETSE